MEVSEVTHIVDPHRTANAALFPVRGKHKVTEEELATSFKQLQKAQWALRTFKHILFFNFDDG